MAWYTNTDEVNNVEEFENKVTEKTVIPNNSWYDNI